MAAGILADGRLRDFAELEHYDLAIYCRGETTRWGGDIVTPYEANRPVVIGGVAIHPGDYVFADASGAAVIPAGDVRAVLHTANQVVAADAQSVVTIRVKAQTHWETVRTDWCAGEPKRHDGRADGDWA